MEVVVIGAGVIGLSSAIAIQNLRARPQVTIISEKFSPQTTGDGAAGLWGPYLLGDTPPEKVRRWSEDTHKYFHRLWMSDLGGVVGICMMPCTRVTKDVVSSDPEWKDVVFGYRNLTKDELDKFPISQLNHGNEFVTFTCEPTKWLPFLLQQFQQNGGRVIKGTVDSLDRLSDKFDIIVNCSGLNASSLVPDNSVQPKRGQVMRVEAPEQNHILLDDSDDGNYIIPNQETVVLGGTHQENDWNLNTDPIDTQFIKDGCLRINPSLKYAKVVNHWVGLRPGRPSVRLEKEIRQNGRQKSYTVVHNYGHGGSGITLAWGCALEAASLVEDAFQQFGTGSKSKL